MKKIQIQAAPFFELLKAKDTSMWEIFAQMIDGEEKELFFLDQNGGVLFSYVLPANAEKLEADRKEFSLLFAEKLAAQNN